MAITTDEPLPVIGESSYKPNKLRVLVMVAGMTGIYLIGSINAGDYAVVRHELREGKTRSEIEEQFDRFYILDPAGKVFNFIGMPGRELAYRMHD